MEYLQQNELLEALKMNIKHLNVETLGTKYLQNISTEFYSPKVQINVS